MRETTEIRINEYGDEEHESWVSIRANNVSASLPGAALFDSDIRHQHLIVVEVARCTRKRDLNRDWLHETEHLLRLEMSQAQWGAFVSSFGQGSAVPATLDYLIGVGDVPRAPWESRFDQSHAEVRNAGENALESVNRYYAEVMAAFEAGRKAPLREALRSLGYALDNAPKNMEFAAESLTEHVEKVVTKARYDIEAMARAAYERGELESPDVLALEPGEES